jgi:glycosyltransferase involved in cell wall biosynthesis
VTTVLHVIPALSRGGPSRALLTAASATSGADLEHVVVSLASPDAYMTRLVQLRGIDVHAAPTPEALSRLIGAADVVQLHFWNSPALYELLGRELPPMRLLVWSHVSGEHPPQVLPRELLELADKVVASCDYTTELPGLEGLEVVPAVAGWDRVAHVEPRNRDGYTVGFVGKLDFAKIHPAFVSMCASVEVPHARFVVCGVGSALPALRRQAAELGIAERLELRGFVEDIGAALAEMDVLGYPLADGTSAASELALQEAMYAGVPPVVMDTGGPRRVVTDGKTGLVVDDPAGYAEAVASLHDRPEVRRRLGAAAREHAIRTWSPEIVAPRWTAIYDSLLSRRKRAHAPYPLTPTGAERFARSLGGGAPAFLRALGSPGGDVLAAEREVAASPAVLWTGGGGILEYRDHYPEDASLRLWAGLVLHRNGRPALAAGELAAAIRLGLDDPRVRTYLDAAKRAARAEGVAAEGARILA